jgi:hypothetical protein
VRRLLLCVIAALLASSGCAPLFPDFAAVVVINVESLPIFFKSYKWGRNGYSSVLSLDRSSTRLPMPGQWECCLGDYRWPAHMPPLLVFKVEGGALHLWDYSSWEPPREGRLGQLVKFHEVDILTHIRMREDPESFGVSVLNDMDILYAEPPVEPIPVSQVLERSAHRRRRR